MMHNPVHPGIVVREDFFKELGISVTDGAQALGVSRVTLSRVLNGRAPVSANMALRLEQAGIGTAQLWLDMQTSFDLANARKVGLPQVERLVPSAA